MKNYSFMLFPNFKNKAVTLSYDDGTIYDEKLISIMSANGLKGTFNLNSGRFVSPGETSLPREEALKLYTESGNEVAVHGKEHLALTSHDDAVITNEILSDRITLEKMFGTIVNGMAYAYGFYNDKIIEIIQNCGIVYSRTTISTEKFDIPTDWLRMPATCHHDNPRLMELAHTFAEGEPAKYSWQKKPKLFYLWGHSFEFNNKNNWEVIEEFAEYIGGRNDIWYATNGEIYRYVKAFDSLKFGAEGKMVYNPSALDVYVDYYGKQYIIPAGKTINL